MNVKKIISACALLGCSAVAQAQLYVATGGSGVTASFNFSIDTGTNQVTVVVDNMHAGINGTTGTVTSFGFNLPVGLAAGGSLLSAVGVPSGWSYFAPYGLSNFEQDAGAGS